MWPTQSLITERILKWLAPRCIGDKWPRSALSPALWRPPWIEMIFIKTALKKAFHHCIEWSRFVAPPADPHSSGEFKDGLSSFMLFGRSPWHTLRHCSWLAYRKWRTVRPLTCNSADPDLILLSGFQVNRDLCITSVPREHPTQEIRTLWVTVWLQNSFHTENDDLVLVHYQGSLAVLEECWDPFVVLHQYRDSTVALQRHLDQLRGPLKPFVMS